MKIKLTIASAVYNIDEPLLRAHIETIIPQLTDETELLLIDDCSSNGSDAVCREYEKPDGRIRYIGMGTNGGLSRVRNRSIEEAAGKWIFFADGDDLLSDTFVKTALGFTDTSCDIIIHERLKFVDTKPAESPHEPTDLILLPPEAGRDLSISCMCLDVSIAERYGLPSRAFYHAAWGALYRKDFLTENLLRFPDGQKKAQDAVFNTRAYRRAKTIAYLPRVMYYYRNNPKGITRRYSADLPEVLRSLIAHLESCRKEYYSDDGEVEAKFLNNRITASVIDDLRLNVFHKNNPKPKKQRKKDFLELLEEEPYKTAIAAFDAKKSKRWEWLLLVKLMRKKRFNALDAFVKNDFLYRTLCGAYGHTAKLFG